MSTPQPHVLVVPVKAAERAKSRLSGLPDDVRRDLVRAFAMDALNAAAGCPLVGRVAVVTDDGDLATWVRAQSWMVLPDRGAGDLNLALARAVHDLEPGTSPVAAMLGDLPCLVEADLTAALAAAGVEAHAAARVAPGGWSFVADAQGTGTTMVSAPDAARFTPRFGTASRRAHVEAGAAEITLPLPTLRRDVDTADDLTLALALGVGPVTAGVLGSR